jgi:2',3'-cyclic-nucleotide 2'-phosphodiesterase (5'-nucleotidase family)
MRARWLILIFALLIAGSARAESVHLTLLHTADLHGALDGWDYLADRPAPRGLTRIATLVRRARAEGNATLLLDGGDAIQGGIEFWYQHGDRAKPEPMMSAMSAIGYDAMALGNHEFSFGRDALERAHRDARFAWLSANVIDAATGKPARDASLVRVMNGVRVGVVGLTTPATVAFEDPETLKGLRFDSPIEAAKTEVARLRQSEHCDVVVLLAHTGLGDSAGVAPRAGDTPDENLGLRIATEVPGVDVVILGHTHVVIPSRTIGGVLVTQAGRWGENLGRIDLTLDRDGAAWKLTNKTARVIAVTDSVPEDSALAALAAPYRAAAREDLDRVIGHLDVPVSSPAGRAAPGAAWDLIQRTQLVATAADVSLAALPDANVTLAAGPVRVRDLWRLYPYDNTLSVIELTGAQLAAALEQSARALRTYDAAAGQPLFDPAYPAWNFDAAAGIGYDIDVTQPVGHRVGHLTFHGAPLSREAKLRVAVNSYRVNGGGAFEMLKSAPRLSRVDRAVPLLIGDAIKAGAGADTAAVMSWRLIPDYVLAPERELIDRLVRQHVLTLSELRGLNTAGAATEGEASLWLKHAFTKTSSLEEEQRPAATAAARTVLREQRALDLCMQAAQRGGYSIGAGASATATPHAASTQGAAKRKPATAPDTLAIASFRRSLATNCGGAPAGGSADVSRARMLGMISNLRFPTIRVLETADFHGFIFSTTRERRTHRPVGGSVALAACVQQLRSENPEGTVLVDGGDWFQGTMVSNLQFGRPVVEQMNLLGYAAAAIGNHDFDWTVDTLAARASEMHFAALGANCIVRKTGRLPAYARADTVVARRGVRVGILGLCYRETPTVTLPENVKMLRFADDSATAARIIPELRRQRHAQIVVAVGHIPAETDSTQRAVSGDLPRLAHGVRGADAWLGGHSHNQIVDEIAGVPVLISGAHGEVVGVVDLTFDPLSDRVIEHRARLVPAYGDANPPDSAWTARVAAWNAGVAPVAAEPLGRNAHRLTRAGDSTVGYLVTDAMRFASHADVALTNGGGLRADLPEGTVTRGAIYEVMPFDNTIVTLEMTGDELRRVLEEGLKAGHVLQPSGIKLTYDPGKPEMQRIVSLTLADGSPLADANRYKIAINNFIATGGDGFTSFAKFPSLTDTHLPLRDAMEALVKEKSANGGALDYSPEGRVTRVGGGRP